MKIFSYILFSIPLLLVKFSYADPKINKVCFKSTTNLTKNGSYYQEKHNLMIKSLALLDYKATTGYTIDPTTIAFDNTDPTSPCISINADRKASTETREWVQEQMGIRWNESNMVTGERGDKTPNELNFAMLVSITFILDDRTYFSCGYFMLGQGSMGLDFYNWWIFSNNNKQNYTLSCIINQNPKRYHIDMKQQEMTDSLFDLGFARALESQ